MQIIHHITIDMARRLPVVPVSAVQGDGNTRILQVTLLENGESWAVPEGVTAGVAFRKPDGTKGLYDTLPNGTKAVTITGGTVSAILAPQVLSCAGEVRCAVVFHDSDFNQLATFPFTVKAAGNPAAGQGISNDYYRYSTMEAVSEAVEAALADVRNALEASTPAIVCEASGEVISAADASDRLLKGLSIYGKTLQNGTPTPENPVPLESAGASGAINTTVCGKNLAPPFTIGKGVYDATGEIFTEPDQAVTEMIPIPADGTCVWSNLVSDISSGVYFYNENGKYLGRCRFTERGSLVITPAIMVLNLTGVGGKISYIRLSQIRNKNNTGELEQVNTQLPMLNIGTTAEPYEPYRPIQTLTASTPNGLPGIPVASGGNYTDENGQQWICDEIDFGRGVYVQRVDVQVCNGSENWELYTNLPRRFAIRNTVRYANGRDSSSAGPVCLSNHFRGIPCDAAITDACWLQRNYLVITDIDNRFADATALKGWLAENPTTFMFPIVTPIETPLSAEELAQYAALHSNKPNTTVFNDSGAGMKMDYVADTKNYIDQKLAAISAAMLS